MKATEFIRSESWKKFKELTDFDNQPSGFSIFRVKIIDPNDGSFSCKYATDDTEREDMTAVSDGYYYECAWMKKK